MGVGFGFGWLQGLVSIDLLYATAMYLPINLLFPAAAALIYPGLPLPPAHQLTFSPARSWTRSMMMMMTLDDFVGDRNKEGKS